MSSIAWRDLWRQFVDIRTVLVRSLQQTTLTVVYCYSDWSSDDDYDEKGPIATSTVGPIDGIRS